MHSSVVLRVRLPDTYGSCGQCNRRVTADECETPLLSQLIRVLQRAKRPGSHFKQPDSCVEKLGAEALGANISIMSGRVLLPLQSLQSLPPRTACLPLSQTRQRCAAELSTNLPAGQLKSHSDWAASCWYHEAGQSLHTESPSSSV